MEFGGRGETRVSVLRDRHSLKENLKRRGNRRAVVCSVLRIRTLISHTLVLGGAMVAVRPVREISATSQQEAAGVQYELYPRLNSVSPAGGPGCEGGGTFAR